MQKLSRSLIALGGLAVLAACGDDVSITPPAEVPIKVTSVTVSPANVSIAVGERVTLSASVALSAGTGTAPATTVTWSPGNATIASVNATTGEVTGAAVGTTTIRATSTADPSISGAAGVNVTSGILGVSLQPGAITLGLGSTYQASATVTKVAASTAAITVGWTVAPAGIVTVSATGLITANAVGTAVVSATSTADATKFAQMNVTVQALPAAVTSLVVAPTAASLGIGDSVTVVPTVTYADGSSARSVGYTSSNPTVATVGAADGKVKAVAPGTAVITTKAKATVTVGTATRTDSLLATTTITVGARASVSIASVTFVNAAGNEVAVPISGAGGQIEVTLNINSGAERVTKVEVFLNGALASAQEYGVNGAPNAPVKLSINTAEFDANYVPRYLNGPALVVARIYPVGAANPTASNTVGFILINPDVVYFDAAGQAHTGNSAAGVGGTWWKGGFTVKSFPVNYSNAIASITYSFNSGGPTGTCAQTSGGTAGPNFSAAFSCTGVESANHNANQALVVTYPATYTLTAPPVAFMTAASAGFVPGRPQWVAANFGSNEDNIGPAVSAVAFSGGLTAVGGDNWAGTPTSWSASATDAGVGFSTTASTTSTPTDVSNDGGTSVLVANVGNPLGLAETLTGSAVAPNYRVSGQPSTDLLGNTGSRGAWSAWFGVDLQVLDAQYADRPALSAVVATIFPLTARGVIYAEAAPSASNPSWTATRDGGTEVVAADAIDTRSGLDNPNAQVSSLVRRTPGGATACASGASDMSNILVDNYVETTTPAQLDCGLAAGSRVGEYNWRASVKDRAGNSKVITDGSSVVDSVWMAIDEALPNITGIGFQTSLYTGGQAATFSFSANDDLELKDGQVQLTYGVGSSGLPAAHTFTYPYGSAIYSSTAFGRPFDGVFKNVINGESLTVGYYIASYDFTTATLFAAPATGNVAGFTSSGITTNVVANVRDVGNQSAAAPLSAPMLSTQIQARASAPGYGASMIDWRVTSKAGGIIAVTHTGPTSSTVTFCERVDIYEADALAVPGIVDAGTTTNLTFRASITAAPTITDNGINRFWAYASGALTAVDGGFYTALCVKSGSGLFSNLL